MAESRSSDVEAERLERNLTDSFEALLGRQVTQQEKLHLLRVKNALGIRDNDALWLILMSLEEYAWRFDKIPEKIKKDTVALIEAHRNALETEALAAAQNAQAKVAEILAGKIEAGITRITRTNYLVSLVWSVMALVLLAVVAFVAGFVMGSGKIPWWMRPTGELTVPQMVVSSVFMAPAGWIFTLLCVPVVGYYGYYNLWLPWDHLEKKERIERVMKASLCVSATLLLLYGVFVF
jgi:hypothetical protein